MSIDVAFSRLAFPELGGPAQAEAEARSHTQGHAAGYAAGLRAAELVAQRRAAAHAELQRLDDARTSASAEALIASLQLALRAVESRIAPVLAEAQSTLAASAIELAEAILGSELAEGEASARSAVTRALAGVDTSLVLLLRLHPDTLAALDGALLAQGITVAPDATLTPGDAMVDFADGYLDARISTALARAKAVLLEGPA